MQPLLSISQLTILLLISLISFWICAVTSVHADTRAEDPRTDEQVAALLAQANLALSEDRLSVPAENNAVSYAQQVLNLVPSQPDALAILRAVVSRYSSLGDQALQRAEALRNAEIVRASLYQGRGQRVARAYQLEQTSIKGLQDRITEARQIDRSFSHNLSEAANLKPNAFVEKIDHYLNLSDRALNFEELKKAQSYLSLAKDWIERFKIPLSQRHRLIERLAKTEEHLVERNAVHDRAANSLPSGFKTSAANSEKSVFIPPSF